MTSTPDDWFSEVERYLRTGVWDDRYGLVPMDPDTDVPADVRAKFKIKIDPGLAQSRKGNGHAAEAPSQRNGSAEQATGGSDDGFSAQIRAEMLDYGIETPPVSFIPDGKFHAFRSRAGSQKPKGWYIIHTDPSMTTWSFGDWIQPDTKNPRKNRRSGSRGNSARELTPEDYAAHRQRLRQHHEQIDAAKFQAWEEAAADAKLRWDTLKLAPASNAYLKKKQIKAFGARVEHGNLVIPMQDIEGKLWSLQEINEDWKLNQKGGRRAGCFTRIGEFTNEGPICVCEGFATGATLHTETSYGVACAGDAGNIERVARAIRGKYPDAPLIICGDDDWLARYDNGIKNNTGQIRAEWAAKAVDGIVVFPWFNPAGARPPKATDFNDEARLYGPGEVRTMETASSGRTLVSRDFLHRPVRTPGWQSRCSASPAATTSSTTKCSSAATSSSSGRES